ncbi:MAG: helix-turn-helix transcriptional regulator, partial [Paludibacteraceae bacterium]|nr:helix-turn-helix transcriptional regulator [Paludibacteraceae bacterium]
MLFASKIKRLREESGQLQRKVAAALDVDAGLYSKIERGERPAKREQVIALASIFNIDEKELLTLWLADQVYGIVEYEQTANDVLNIVAENI